uniref:Uncharacterized protein n=1 Tax=Podoviridae sp. ctG4L18 TaxID=2825234 RepID=A0A8S5UNW2_9CAUD|nr:MAG TPA: hypothetical protein [Podoviridae sp. ctG4L18]
MSKINKIIFKFWSSLYFTITYTSFLRLYVSSNSLWYYVLTILKCTICFNYSVSIISKSLDLLYNLIICQRNHTWKSRLLSSNIVYIQTYLIGFFRIIFTHIIEPIYYFIIKLIIVFQKRLIKIIMKQVIIFHYIKQIVLVGIHVDAYKFKFISELIRKIYVCVFLILVMILP